MRSTPASAADGTGTGAGAGMLRAGCGARGFTVTPSVLLAPGGMLVSSCRNELIMASLSMSSTLVFFAIVPIPL
ncbi:hypothetical protein M139_4745 [Bacteroides fragilis str. S23L24]|nr:hypothetical protein M139_4925 [Bacteroides fragilis str. S23L24]EYA63920.1 hypothetical protein M139_4818 [Bacteroides fragilis str. S23L24]EYA63990.1 hypothetical protein M139_4745 [Bacteroides fragilis str. S23L24]